jgi:hypothetical protein
MPDLSAARWRKSSFSVADGNCVEVATLADGQLAVRDSKFPDQGAILFTSAEMSAWIERLKG